MDGLRLDVQAALRSTDRLKLRASSDRCGISTTTKTSTAQLRRNLQQWLEDVDGLVLPPRCSAVILRRAFTTVLCSSVALVCARRDYAVISVGTLSTSIVYWRKPRRGSVERQFDRLWVLLSFLYQGRSACRELGAGRLAAYWALALITLCCYARARRLGGCRIARRLGALALGHPPRGQRGERHPLRRPGPRRRRRVESLSVSRGLLGFRRGDVRYCGARGRAGAETAKARAAAVAAPRRRHGWAGARPRSNRSGAAARADATSAAAAGAAPVR